MTFSGGQINGRAWGLPDFTYEQVSAGGQMLSNHGYIVGAVTLTLLNLPVVASVGDRIIVVRDGPANWRITQGVGQQMRVGNMLTTPGITGCIESTDLGDEIEATCLSPNYWSVNIFNGNIEVI